MKAKHAAIAKIESRKAKVGIIGLGYVGLPLATEFAKAGFSVTGFEVDARKVEALSAGKSYIEDISSQAVSDLIERGRFAATLQFSKLRDMDAIIICVP